MPVAKEIICRRCRQSCEPRPRLATRKELKTRGLVHPNTEAQAITKIQLYDRRLAELFRAYDEGMEGR